MYNKDFIRFEKLKQELNRLQTLCPNQYFAVEKCSAPLNNKCVNDRLHVDRFLYPCIHYFTGNCKYGMNCHFQHHIKRQIPRPEPQKETCKKLYFENSCPMGNKCKFSHDLSNYPCYYNSIGKCRFDDDECRYDHKTKLELPLVCFFDLMKGCNKSEQECQNKHITDGVTKYLSYDGPIWFCIATQKLSNFYFWVKNLINQLVSSIKGWIWKSILSLFPRGFSCLYLFPFLKKLYFYDFIICL